MDNKEKTSNRNVVKLPKNSDDAGWLRYACVRKTYLARFDSSVIHLSTIKLCIFSKCKKRSGILESNPDGQFPNQDGMWKRGGKIYCGCIVLRIYPATSWDSSPAIRVPASLFRNAIMKYARQGFMTS